MLIWIFMYMFMCGHMFSFLMGIYLGVALLGQMVALCLNFEELSDFSIMATFFYVPTNSVWGSNFSASSPKLLKMFFLILTIPVSVEWCKSLWFWFAFPIGLMMLSFLLAIYRLFFFFLKNVCSELRLFLIG